MSLTSEKYGKFKSGKKKRNLFFVFKIKSIHPQFKCVVKFFQNRWITADVL